MVGESILAMRRAVHDIAYQGIVKPLCFRCDAEQTHRFFALVGKELGRHALTRRATQAVLDYQERMLEQEILGMRFRNPIGLAAGFDKNAELMHIMESVGFGFVEVGSVTALPCEGNTGIRLRRDIEKKSIWVNLGLNNDGVEEIAARLRKEQNEMCIPVGVSVARTNCREAAETEAGISDYMQSFRVLRETGAGDYYALNISCPNAFGGQPFSEPRRYARLMRALSALRIDKPVFVKLSPDLRKREIDVLLSISKRCGIVRGFICTNLTKKGMKKSGGFSGKSVEEKANELLRYVYSKTRGSMVLIGVGGVFSAEDAYTKIRLGANLVQLITGMIFQGPGLIGQMNHDLARFLRRDRFGSVKDAVGADVR